MNSVGALYVHVPYCARKCLYCDFPSDAVEPQDSCLCDMTKSVVRQIEALSKAGFLSQCRTAYIGGGTPSFLGPNLLSRMVRAIREACPHLEELTFEANPDSLTNGVIKKTIEAGATRVSVGVQSLSDNELRALGRIHTAEQARARVSAAVGSGLNVSVDLMCAIPRQTASSWKQTLDDVCNLGVGHVSVYPLAIEPHTPFDDLYGGTSNPWNSEEVQAERMEYAQSRLEAAGLLRYEVASYAQRGCACRHNEAYWTGVPYIGIGAGASSMLEREQYLELKAARPELPCMDTTTSRVRLTLAKGVLDYEFLTKRQAWAEDLMLGMRMVRGVEAHTVPISVAKDLISRGLVTRQKERLVPTHDGWLLGNELYGALWDLADSDVVQGSFEIGNTDLWQI